MFFHPTGVAAPQRYELGCQGTVLRGVVFFFFCGGPPFFGGFTGKPKATPPCCGSPNEDTPACVVFGDLFVRPLLLWPVRRALKRGAGSVASCMERFFGPQPPGLHIGMESKAGSLTSPPFPVGLPGFQLPVSNKKVGDLDMLRGAFSRGLYSMSLGQRPWLALSAVLEPMSLGSHKTGWFCGGWILQIGIP